MFAKLNKWHKAAASYGSIYNLGTMKVIVMACLCIALAVFIMGGLSYFITERAVLNKLKSKDLLFIIKSIDAKIDARIAMAEELSLILAEDPLLIEWVEGKEKDDRLGQLALRQIANITRNHNYDNSFIVSTITGHYWTEKGKLIDTMSKYDADDSWFFETIASKTPVSISIDYNKERDDTFVFVNALMGDCNRPIAVTGVGFNLKDIAREFAGYKFGEKSRLWLIDREGQIHLAEDLEDRGKNISDVIPEAVSNKVLQTSNQSIAFGVLEYKDARGELTDLVYRTMQSTDWRLILQIPRIESTGFLKSIEINTLLASVFCLILVVFIFYLIVDKIANPLKRAVILSHELERQVQERTGELQEKNAKIMDSIDYAKRIQETIIPDDQEMAEAFSSYFVLWQPRDLVGGDFYWFKKKGNDYVLAIVDCTGHGVPGALMTMAVSSILNHIVDEICFDDPAVIFKELNARVKSTLHKKANHVTDDGADIGICHIKDGKLLTFAGARIALYIMRAGGLEIVQGDKQSIGYQKSKDDFNFKKVCVAVEKGDKFYMTTDGYIDQNGGPKDYPFGKKRFAALINEYAHLSLTGQKQIFIQALADYRQEELQRDDITVIGFQI
ncbi:protein serine/threonine phosphatase [Desulfofarcimen acetoxidans DSM 771]|jgi:serine phosphatase RsbU (regulator of sigma subunit)|uniref:Protein serine/threonine phosphatase n=1 Tax=Desulfofarcimen acetoxidans (strain ATCC 49208 / DSM 771 / KCTC 5769 / VKM B-1644 / 5575) TaxID=485916 RepID=C8VZI8_DESAS|nr:SpoIIE family protein phosphatase [Desulfofarcimen acetoxidans]ACV64933.1 protein serine/threonine phosphatase [Desulfofarcimen acetoxidans DSM 771]